MATMERKGGTWAREDIYCNISDYTGRKTGGNQFQLIADCYHDDFPLTGFCHTGTAENIRLAGGEHDYWEKTDVVEPRFVCTFEWTVPPPYPSPLESGAKAEICCVRRHPKTNPLGKF